LNLFEIREYDESITQLSHRIRFSSYIPQCLMALSEKHNTQYSASSSLRSPKIQSKEVESMFIKLRWIEQPFFYLEFS